MRTIVEMSVAVAAALVGCGGHGSDGIPVPVNSTASFPIESAFDVLPADGDVGRGADLPLRHLISLDAEPKGGRTAVCVAHRAIGTSPERSSL